ncbi:hypothetical protein PCC8801_2650 [Rippkaea orientalis PCC 8801]|uniref:Uncharacterized protein n=1 Tax=Rippkaea orientalis (strain PCC 8801 / RF-1) TaxID=41431 RepID=B7K4Z6_RIPO1|nr:hypothetical protein [Rippkaea orientalis]ACK66652.1 hypothetical protein PCC8801_2650 [Rippkaea orientalis PCC 8801]
MLKIMQKNSWNEVQEKEMGKIYMLSSNARKSVKWLNNIEQEKIQFFCGKPLD